MEGWLGREALELRYDGPIPAADRPAADPAEQLRRRMRLHRRLALDYARQAGGTGDDPGRSLRHFAGERRSHSRLARLLGEVLRRA